MTKASASQVLQVVGLALLVVAVVMLAAGRRLRRQELAVVGEAEITVVRENLRQDGSE